MRSEKRLAAGCGSAARMRSKRGSEKCRRRVTTVVREVDSESASAFAKPQPSKRGRLRQRVKTRWRAMTFSKAAWSTRPWA